MVPYNVALGPVVPLAIQIWIKLMANFYLSVDFACRNASSHKPI